MEVSAKRFTISVSDEMAIQLDKVKQAKYYNTSQNKMIQDLICLGLESIQKDLDKSTQNIGGHYEEKDA